MKRAGLLADAQNYTRDLVNTAPNVLFPQRFADSVKARAAGSAVKVAVMDEKALAKAGCGGIIGVGQGSVHPPRIVTMTYEPAVPRPGRRTWPSSARASRSTPAACASSRPPAW